MVRHAPEHSVDRDAHSRGSALLHAPSKRWGSDLRDVPKLVVRSGSRGIHQPHKGAPAGEEARSRLASGSGGRGMHGKTTSHDKSGMNGIAQGAFSSCGYRVEFCVSLLVTRIT